MFRPLCLAALFAAAFGCAELTGKRHSSEARSGLIEYDINGLGKRLDGTDQPNNALAGLTSNKFNSWQISHRVDIPAGPDGKLKISE